MTIRFGLIGCGRVAPRHAQSLTQLKQTDLVAVADIRPARAARFAEEFHATAYADAHELLARADVDAVSICVPSGLHAQLAIDALEAGKHVLVEKPVALSLEDADRMIAAAARTGRIHPIDGRMVSWYGPRIAEAIQALARLFATR